MQILEIYLSILVLAAISSHVIDEEYYQPPQFVGDSTIRWAGFLKWCTILNQENRFWEAQKIFTILIPVLSQENVVKLFHEYCDCLKGWPRTDETAIAELAATNAYLSWISREMSQDKHQGTSRTLDEALNANLNAISLLQHLFRENAIMRGRRFDEWKDNQQRLLDQVKLVRTRDWTALQAAALTGSVEDVKLLIRAEVWQFPTKP